MFLVLLAFIGYMWLVERVIFEGLRIGSFLTSLGALFALGVALAIWALRHLTRPSRRPAAPAPQPAPPAAAPAGSAASFGLRETTFRVAGVTFDNDDGTSRQEILRGLRWRESPYASGDDDLTLTTAFFETEYIGQPAIEVHINDYMIGHVPKSRIPDVSAAIASCSCTVDDVAIYGGGYDDDGIRHSYGCEITISWAD